MRYAASSKTLKLKNTTSQPQRRLFGLAALALSLIAIPVKAQYQSVEEVRKQTANARDDAVTQAQNSYIGKRYWIVPNPKAIMKPIFRKRNERIQSYEESFVLTEPASFTVTGFATGLYGPRNVVEVTFDDGKVAFLERVDWFRPEDYKHLFRDEYDGTGYYFDHVQYILTASPPDIAETERKTKAKEAAAAKAWKARGGVRIGMTQKQVIASAWGRPESVNKTIGSFGTHEQWVYGNGNFLYFENGILKTIQN